VGSAGQGEIIARLFKAQLPVYCKPDLGGVYVLLAVIFPPANGTEAHRAGRLKSLISATGTAEPGHGTLRSLTHHDLIDGKMCRQDYAADPGAAFVPVSGSFWLRHMNTRRQTPSAFFDEQNFIALRPNLYYPQSF
jgi:hypothetical protein